MRPQGLTITITSGPMVTFIKSKLRTTKVSVKYHPHNYLSELMFNLEYKLCDCPVRVKIYAEIFQNRTKLKNETAIFLVT